MKMIIIECVFSGSKEDKMKCKCNFIIRLMCVGTLMNATLQFVFPNLCTLILTLARNFCFVVILALKPDFESTISSWSSQLCSCPAVGHTVTLMCAWPKCVNC